MFAAYYAAVLLLLFSAYYAVVVLLFVLTVCYALTVLKTCSFSGSKLIGGGGGTEGSEVLVLGGDFGGEA
jgi:hypothetical protein